MKRRKKTTQANYHGRNSVFFPQLTATKNALTNVAKINGWNKPEGNIDRSDERKAEAQAKRERKARKALATQGNVKCDCECHEPGAVVMHCFPCC
jgi:hypothetical protein